MRKAVAATPELKLVFDRGVPANTTDYTLLVNNVEAAKPDALLEFGYPANEIAFLHAMQDNGTKFKFLFTGYGLTEMALMRTNGVADQLANTYALASPAIYEFKVNYGLDRDHFKEAFEHWVESRHRLPGVEFGYNAIAGYQAGLDHREGPSPPPTASTSSSCGAPCSPCPATWKRLAGPFILAPDGSQSGEILPLGQIVPGKTEKDYGLNIVWPADLATAKPIYPAP